MGRYVSVDDVTVYQQPDGEITAWLVDFEEKAVLRHKGSAEAKRILYLCVAAAVIYLGLVFIYLDH